MKKSLLLLASLLVSVASFAQWTKPVPKATDSYKYSVKADSLQGDTTIYYLYNKDAQAFFNQGNAWGTQATIKNRGLKMFVSKYIPTSTDDEGNVTTGEWDGKSVILTDYCESKGGWYDVVITLDSDSKMINGLYVDRGNQVDYFFEITSKGSGVYQISCADSNPQANPTAATYVPYVGVSGNTQESNGTVISADIDAAEDAAAWINWQFITPEAYEEYLPLVEQYEAATALGEYIEKVQSEYPNINTAAAEKVYNNTSSTTEELTAAKNALVEAVKNYEFSTASEDNPVDATKFLQNPNFDTDISGWDCTFEKGVNATNIGYQSANYTNGEVKINAFIEAWTPNAMNENIPGVNAIGVGQLSQTIKDMPQGKYRLSVDCIAVAQNVSENNPVKGVQLFATGGDIDVYTALATGNGKPEHFDLTFVNDGDEITMGLRTTAECVANWIAADNFQLTYFGPTDEDPAKIVMDEIVNNALAAYPEEDFEEVKATQSLKDAFSKAIEDAKAATEGYEEAGAAVTAAKADLNASVEAYKSYIQQVKEIRDYLAINDDMEGEKTNLLADYTLEGNEVEPDEDNPYGSADYILANLLPTTEQITEETARIAALFKEAVAESLYEGKDCTNLIADADFSDKNGKGWTVGKLGAPGAWTGGLIASDENPDAGFPVAEAWNKTFDIYQEVSVPNGVYAVSLNGFVRRGEAGSDANAEITAEIYMNNFSTKFTDIQEGGIPMDENAVDGFNCYLSNGPTSAALTTNPIFMGGTHQSPNDATDTQKEDLYAPNGMEGASVAFSAGRYKAVAYGLVTDGKIRLGVRNTSTGQWTLWGNFKLTYMGKNAEALESILPIYREQLATYEETNQDNLTEPTVANIEKALAKADEAADADEMYDALIVVNDAYIAAQANKAAVEAFKAEEESLNAVCENYPDADQSAYEALADQIAAYSELSTEGVEALTAKMKDAEKAIIFACATEDNPVDITNLFIVNPDFSDASINGWTDTFTAGNHGYQSNSTYGDINQFMEAWINSPAASPNHLSNGSISQEISLPAGSYVLSIDAIAKDQAAGEEVVGIYLFAGENRTALNADSTDPGHFEVEFVLTEASTIAIGVVVEDTNGNWFAADNFKLECKGADITAIQTITSNINSAANGIYTVSGARISKMQKGINIIQSNGKVQKVLVK